MKTFDIAIKHLSGVDFKKLDLYNCQNPETEFLVAYHNNFKNDPQNNKSNSFYRCVVFATAMLHLVFKAANKTSFWDVATMIVESNIEILKTDFEKYKNTAYPKVMVDYWIDYYEKIKQETTLLDGELNLDYFFAAYHYIAQPEIA